MLTLLEFLIKFSFFWHDINIKYYQCCTNDKTRVSPKWQSIKPVVKILPFKGLRKLIIKGELKLKK